MKVLIDFLILFIVLFWQAYMQAIIITTLYSIENARKKNLIFSLIAGIVGATLKLVLPPDLSIINTITIWALIIFAFKFLYNRSISESIIYTLILSAISIPTEAIAGLITFKVLKFETNVQNVVGMLPIFLLINMWFSIIAFLIHLYKVKKNENNEILRLSELANTSTYINIILIVLIISPNIMIYAKNKYNYPLYLLIFNILANILFVFVGLYNTYKSVQLEIKKKELILSEQHNKTLNDLLDNIRVFKHDYNNIVHSIGGYISFNDMKGLKRYYDGLSKESKKVNILESISPRKINEPSVYTLINTKYQEAAKKGITFTIETMADYREIAMPIFDFTKILGIFLDNAIEAAEEVEEKEINILYRCLATEKIQVFTIENTYKDYGIDTEQIFEKDFSTKNRNSGIGLWEVKNIVERNENVALTTQKDEKYFVQRLFISENITPKE